MYAEVATGHPPVPPAQLALTVILQAYTNPRRRQAFILEWGQGNARV